MSSPLWSLSHTSPYWIFSSDSKPMSSMPSWALISYTTMASQWISGSPISSTPSLSCKCMACQHRLHLHTPHFRAWAHRTSTPLCLPNSWENSAPVQKSNLANIRSLVTFALLDLVLLLALVTCPQIAFRNLQS